MTGHLIERPLLREGVERVAPKDIVFWRALVPLAGDSGGPWSSLVFAMGFAAFWLAVAAVLWRRDIRIQG